MAGLTQTIWAKNSAPAIPNAYRFNKSLDRYFKFNGKFYKIRNKPQIFELEGQRIEYTFSTGSTQQSLAVTSPEEVTREEFLVAKRSFYFIEASLDYSNFTKKVLANSNLKEAWLESAEALGATSVEQFEENLIQLAQAAQPEWNKISAQKKLSVLRDLKRENEVKIREDILSTQFNKIDKDGHILKRDIIFSEDHRESLVFVSAERELLKEAALKNKAKLLSNKELRNYNTLYGLFLKHRDLVSPL